MLVLIVAFLVGTMMGMKVLGMIDNMISLFDAPGAVTFGLAVIIGAGVAYLAAKLIGLVVRLISSRGFGEWYGNISARWNARLHDHRMTMVGAGLVTLLLTIVLFGTLPQSFFPPTNSDYSRVNITLPPGTTLKQTEAVTDQVAALV